MAMRRPRIKAAANLVNIKRKSKVTETNTKGVAKSESDTANKILDETDKSLKEEKNNLNEESKLPEQITDKKITLTSTDLLKETNLNNSTDSSRTELTPTFNGNAHDEQLKVVLNVAQHDYSPTMKEIEVDQNMRDEEKDFNENSQRACANKSLTMIKDIVPRNLNTDTAFKEPHKVEHQQIYSSSQHLKTEDEKMIDMEENILHIDLQRTSNNFPMSPTKQQVRTRIRPSPIMGQRRNSYVGCSPSPHVNDDISNEFVMPSPRRERYNSTSLCTYSGLGGTSTTYSPHKYIPTMTQGRTRNDSTCSINSDTYSCMTSSAQQSLTTQRVRRTKSEHNNRIQWRREYESRCTNGIPDKTRLKMLDLIFYNPSSNPMPTKTPNNPLENAIKEVKEKEDAVIEQKNAKAINAPVPQLKLNANNELVLDDTSLEIETTAEQEARKILANTSLLFIDENTGMNGFYKRHKRTREWPSDETVKFYRCLQTVGTDFSLMAQLFPNRTRRELKLKFKREERSNGVLINKALLYPKSFNVEELKERLEDDERRMQMEARQWRKIQEQQASKIKKNKFKNSKADRILKNGIDVYENEHLPIKKLSNRASVDDSIQSSLSSTTKKILKNHIENSVAKRITTEISDLRNIVQKHGKNKKRSCDENTKKGNARKKQSKAEKDNELITPDVNVLEEELSNILQTSDNDEECIQQVPQTDSSSRKTLVDLDNGQPISIMEEYEPAHDQFSSVKESIADNTSTDLIKCEENEIKCENNNEETSISSDIGEADEETVQCILQQIEEGGLMLVSSIDANNENTIDEIFMIDKKTGDLCQKPLDLPQEIVKIISELVTA